MEITREWCSKIMLRLLSFFTNKRHHPHLAKLEHNEIIIIEAFLCWRYSRNTCHRFLLGLILDE